MFPFLSDCGMDFIWYLSLSWVHCAFSFASSLVIFCHQNFFPTIYPLSSENIHEVVFNCRYIFFISISLYWSPTVVFFFVSSEWRLFSSLFKKPFQIVVQFGCWQFSPYFVFWSLIHICLLIHLFAFILWLHVSNNAEGVLPFHGIAWPLFYAFSPLHQAHIPHIFSTFDLKIFQGSSIFKVLNNLVCLILLTRSFRLTNFALWSVKPYFYWLFHFM